MDAKDAINKIRVMLGMEPIAEPATETETQVQAAEETETTPETNPETTPETEPETEPEEVTVEAAYEKAAKAYDMAEANSARIEALEAKIANLEYMIGMELSKVSEKMSQIADLPGANPVVAADDKTAKEKFSVADIQRAIIEAKKGKRS